MGLSSFKCDGCTNICYLKHKGIINEYCRVVYDQPNNKGVEWHGDEVVCLDYTTKPEARCTEVREWFEPMYNIKGSTLPITEEEIEKWAERERLVGRDPYENEEYREWANQIVQTALF